METLTTQPGPSNITRVVHQVSLQVVEIDNDAKHLRVALLNPDGVLADIVLVMLRDAVRIVEVMVQAGKEGKP